MTNTPYWTPGDLLDAGPGLEIEMTIATLTISAAAVAASIRRDTAWIHRHRVPAQVADMPIGQALQQLDDPSPGLGWTSRARGWPTAGDRDQFVWGSAVDWAIAAIDVVADWRGATAPAMSRLEAAFAEGRGYYPEWAAEAEENLRRARVARTLLDRVSAQAEFYRHFPAEGQSARSDLVADLLDWADNEILRESCDHGRRHLTLAAHPDGLLVSLTQAGGDDVYASMIVTEPETARRIARHLVAWADKQEQGS